MILRLVNLSPIALFSKYKSATSSGKHLESIEHGHIACLLCIFLTTDRGCDDLSIGFDRSRDRRQRELTNNKKKIKRNYHVRIYSKDIFGFNENQVKGRYGLGYILTMTRNIDSAVLNKDNATNNAKIKINNIHCYVPHYAPSLEQQGILFKHFQSETPTELQYPGQSILMKEINTQSLLNFELGTQEGVNVPIWVFVIFKQSDREYDQNLNNDTFCRLPVTSAQCIIGTERYPDSAILLNYDDDDYSQGYWQIWESLRALTKDDILQHYIIEVDFRPVKNGDKNGYNKHVFDRRYQKNFERAQPIKLELKFSENISSGLYGYGLTLTDRIG